MTVRDALTPFGLDRIIAADPELLDVEIARAVFASTPGTADLQVCCGGDAIMAFRPANPCRRELLLVRDDRAGEVWDVRNRELGGYAPTRLGPRPHAKLRLVQTA